MTEGLDEVWHNYDVLWQPAAIGSVKCFLELHLNSSWKDEEMERVIDTINNKFHKL